jgi:hypothetical protein
MRPGALPIGQMILLDIVVPPIGTCVWWLMARGWAGLVQLGRPSETTKRRQKWEFLAILIAAYLLVWDHDIRMAKLMIRRSLGCCILLQ